MAKLFFWGFLLLICGYAFVRGRNDERLAAATCMLAVIATRLVIPPREVRFSEVEPGLVVIDMLVFAAFLFIALRSERFWPLWIAGLQLTNSLSHMMKAFDSDLLPKAYAAAAMYWSYPILLIIAIGTWRTHRRTRIEDRQPI